jgi:raffinose/stachyose/melibiose transport system substrate-binding protein
MKKLLSVVLIGLASLGLVFAGGSSEAASGAAAGKIIIFQSKVEITSQLQEAAAEYTKATGVEVEVWETTGDDYLQQLKTRIANQQGPSLYSLAPGAESDQMAAYMADLSELPFIGNINQSLVVKKDGKPTGVPYTMEGFGMVYNKSMLSPDSVRDYASFAKFLQDSKAKGVNGFGLSQESYFLIGHILNWPFAVMPDFAGFMDKLNKGQVKLADTPSFQEWAKFMEAIRQYSYNPLEVNYDKEIGDLATGKSAAIHQGNWAFPMFKDYALNFELGLMPLPLQGNTKLAVSVPSVWAVNSQKGAAEQKLARDFLTWLYTSDAGKRYLIDEFKFIPVVKGTVAANLDPLSADVQKYADAGNTIGWATSLYPAGSVDVYMVPVAQQFFAPGSTMTGAQLLEALDAAWAKMNNR